MKPVLSYGSTFLFWSFICSLPLLGQVNVVTQHNDIARTGQNLNEITLTSSNVSSGNFGKLFSNSVDGQVYAQPLYLSGLSIAGAGTHNVVFVATMHDSVYAFDADSAGAPLWKASLLDAAHGAAAGATTDPVGDTGCTELEGTEIGITGTPVIDPLAGIVYVVGRTFENGYPVERLHALDVTTGLEKLAPVTLSGSVSGTGTGSSNGILNFDPKWENQRAGLLLVNGIVYVAFGSYCEHGTSHGWILAYNAGTLTQTSVFVTSPNASGSGIWMSGTGLSADIPAGSPYGRLFVALGNGTYDATVPYTTNGADYGDDVLRLDLTNGVMKVSDAFTPMDQANLQTTGMDLGSGGVMLLPDQALSGHTHQMLAGGKNGNLYLIDRDSLGGYSTTANNIIEPIVPNQVGGVYGAPAYWNNNVYYWGDEDTLKQFNFTSGLMNFWYSASSSEKQSFPASTPSISANGTANGIVWNVDSSAYISNGSANLLAHDAQNVAKTLYSSATNATRDNPGPAIKFTVPTIANGKVYVPASGQISVFGLLVTPDFTLTPAQASISVAQGASASATITVGALNGFSGVLTLSASALPNGMTVAFTQDLTGFTKYVAFSASSATAVGSYPIVITATAGTTLHSVTLNVTVTAPVVAVASFSLNAGPQIVSTVQGQSSTTNVGIVPANGFNSAVTLSASGVPTGVTASFGAVTSNVSVLTLTSSSAVGAGIYPITIQGTGGGVTSAVNLTLVENAVGQVNVTTQHNDISRSGQNSNEVTLTPANVSGGNFGKLFSVNVDGQMYAQPLYMANVSIPNAGKHNIVYVVTMHDSVYAFDADTQGPPLWQVTLLDSAHGASAGATTDPISDVGCDELLGTELGITGTPVIDPAAGTIYLVGKTFENGYAVQRLHALDITTGAEKTAPATLTAAVAGSGSGSSNNILSFDPKWENQRAGLLLVNGVVYIAFASYCDNGPFHGWVLGYNAQTLVQTGVFTPSPNGSGSGIWMSGTGLAADIPAGSPFGRMFLATGNGTYDAVLPYQTNQADFGDDVLQMDLTNGVMTVTDAFTPMDQAALSAADSDLASGGVMLLPDQPLAGHPHQLLAAGKSGIIYVVDRDSLGGYSTSANNNLETISPKQIGGVFSAPAYWNNNVYYWGISDHLSDFGLTGGLLNNYYSSSSTDKQTFPGSTPAISSNGTTNGIVWNIDSSAYGSYGNENLVAHAAASVATTLYTSATNSSRDNPGLAVKNTVPTISNGKVYVPTYGQLSVYGLLPSTPDFTIAATRPSVTMVQGGSTSDTVSVGVLNGFSGSVSVAANGMPAGVTAVLAAGSAAGTTSITLSSTNTAAIGAFLMTVTGTSGALTHSVVVYVAVTDPNAPSFTLSAAPPAIAIAPGQTGSSNITIVPVNGFSGAVKLVAYGLPTGVTASFAAPVNGIAVLTLAVPASATAGSYSLTISGSSGTVSATAIVTLTVGSQPNFSLTASAVTLVTGQSGSAAVNVAAVNGFNSAVTFSASGLPAGVSAAFSPASSSTGTSVTFTAAASVAPNTYSAVITGTSGSITSSVTVSLNVTLSPSFALTATPAALAVAEGQSGTSNIAIVPANGFSGAVSLTTSTLPSGVTATFGTASNGVSQMTIAAAATVPAQQFNVVVTGTSGALSATTSVALTVTTLPTFTLSAANAVTVTPGTSRNASVSLTAAAGFSGTVTYSAGGLPSGLAATFSPASGTTGTSVTFTAASSLASNVYPVVITGTSGSISSSATVNVEVGYFSQVAVVTQHNDIARSGQNLSETILTPANVSGGNFGKLYSATLDGQVFAQPLYVSNLAIPGAGTHNVVYVPTMHDSVYALDADSGAPLWQVTLLDAAHGAATGATTDPVSDVGCTALGGTEFGIAGTPVIDPVAGVIYVVGRTYENGYPVQRLHALNWTSGAEMPNSPVTLSASVSGTGSGSSNGMLNFDPKWENQRAGLLLLNGMVYIGFGSYCDLGPFHGWILAYNSLTLKQTSAFTPSPNAAGSEISMAGTGLAADVPAGSPFGRLYVPTGHGTYDATLPYGTNSMDYAMDVVRLDLTNGVMNVTDAFTPFDQASLSANSSDLSSGGIMLLPDEPLAGHTHQLLAAGKTGNMYLVDRDSLGGYSSSANNIIEYVSPNQIGGVFGSPAYWNNTVYYWGNGDTLKQFSFTNGLMNFWHLLNSNESIKYPGSTPSISANGSTNGIVWDIDGSAYAAPAGPAVLYAHDATNVSKTLYSSAANTTRDSAGPAVETTVPTVANGKVYVPGYGQLSVYGLLNPDFALSALQTSVNVQPGGSGSSLLTTTALNSFAGTITFASSTLPSGLTVTFAAGSTAASTSVTFSAASATAAGTYPVVLTATSGSISHSVLVNVTVSTAPFFTLTATPAALSVIPGQAGTSSIGIVPVNGFTGSPTFSATGLPSGATVSFGAVASGTSLMTLAATAATAPGTYAVTVTGISGSVTNTVLISLTVTQPLSSVPVQVSLSAAANVYGIVVDGTSAANGGLDTAGYAYSANLLGTSATAFGVTFNFGAAGVADAVANATIALPAANFTNLNLLGSAVYGPVLNQAFVVTYTDGTTSSFTQSLSDWQNPQSFAGETVVSSMAYRGTPSGSEQTGNTYVYGYSFALNPAKTVKSLTLPANRNVTVLAITLSSQPSGTQTAQSITFAAIPPQTAGTKLALAATANSGLPVSFSSSTTGVCSVSGSTLTLLAQGNCSVTASQAGNSSYAPAIPVVEAFNVAAGTAGFSITAPAAAAIQQASNANINITVIPVNGFSGTPVFSVTGLPTGVTTTFSALSSSNVSTLTLTAAANAIVGTYPLTLNATSGATVQSAPLTMSVTHGLSLNAVQIINLATGVCLDVNGISSTPGVGVGQSACWGGGNQLWNLTSVSTGVYEIASVNSGLALDIKAGSTSAGSFAIQNTYSAAASQEWSLQETSDGYFNLVNAGSTLCLDGAESTAAANVESQQQSCSSAASQKWSLVPLSNTTAVNMSGAYNVTAISTAGAATPNGGIDTAGDAFASANLGSTYSWYGFSFTYGAANVADAVTSATVALPGGQYNGLYFLVTATNGAQANQTFTVNYSDGTSTAVQQGINDWSNNTTLFAGEGTAATLAYTLNASGQQVATAHYIYGFHMNLDSSRTAVSVTLPANPNVTVMAMTLGK